MLRCSIRAGSEKVPPSDLLCLPRSPNCHRKLREFAAWLQFYSIFIYQWSTVWVVLTLSSLHCKAVHHKPHKVIRFPLDPNGLFIIRSEPDHKHVTVAVSGSSIRAWKVWFPCVVCLKWWGSCLYWPNMSWMTIFLPWDMDQWWAILNQDSVWSAMTACVVHSEKKGTETVPLHTKYWGSSGVVNFTRRCSQWD